MSATKKKSAQSAKPKESRPVRTEETGAMTQVSDIAEQYPKCKYKRADAAPGYEVVVVADPEEEQALGKVWTDRPPSDEAEEPAPKNAKKK